MWGKKDILYTFLSPIKCRYCEFLLFRGTVLHWTCDIFACGWSCPEAIFAVQLEKMESHHWPQRIPILCFPHNGFEGYCSSPPFVRDLVRSSPGCSCRHNSFFTWLCCSTCIWEIFGQARVILLASSPNYIWGLSICLFFILIQDLNAAWLMSPLMCGE